MVWSLIDRKKNKYLWSLLMDVFTSIVHYRCTVPTSISGTKCDEFNGITESQNHVNTNQLNFKYNVFIGKSCRIYRDHKNQIYIYMYIYIYTFSGCWPTARVLLLSSTPWTGTASIGNCLVIGLQIIDNQFNIYLGEGVNWEYEHKWFDGGIPNKDFGFSGRRGSWRRRRKGRGKTRLKQCQCSDRCILYLNLYLHLYQYWHTGNISKLLSKFEIQINTKLRGALQWKRRASGKRRNRCRREKSERRSHKIIFEKTPRESLNKSVFVPR